MSAIAADTWGIPGPTFAVIYPVLIVAAALAATVARRRVGAGREVPGPPPTATELAYLRGGDKLAVATALGALRAAGALDAQARPVATTLTTEDPLQLAVLHALQAAKSSRQRTVNALSLHAHVRTTLAVLARDLADRGLVRTAADSSRVRRWTLLPWAVVVLGIARIAAGIAGDHPVEYVTLETVGAVVVAALVVGSNSAAATPRGRETVRAARQEHGHLDPKLRPSWTTYGPVGAGLSVALFGPAAILLAEPAFAHTVAAKQAAVGSGGVGGGDSGGSGCAGGSSCGGGGSSCGGGGGCGGGGCGG